MRIATLFSGIGAPEQGAARVYPDHEIIFACEFDKFARQSYMANYCDGLDESEGTWAYEHFWNDVHNLDATEYRGEVDILIGGSPCQAFSIAGLREGTEDERGQLIYQYIRVVEECMPPVIVYENVKGMMSITGGRTIKEFVQALRDIGYYCHYEVINTKDYGVPQNRERLFLVGFLDHDVYHRFEYAPKVKLEKRLKDVLEDEVDEKYYLSDESIAYVANETRLAKKFTSINGEISQTAMAQYSQSMAGTFLKEPQIDMVGLLDVKGTDQIRRVYGTDGIAATLTTMQGGNQEPKIVASRGRNKLNPSDKTPGAEVEQRLEVNEGGISNCLTSVQKDNYVLEPTMNQYPRGVNKGGEVAKDGICPTITINSWEHNCTLNHNHRIRKLTPKECLRLQDFPDTFTQVVSDSQMYKQAGNSMSVNILEMIFNQIEKAKAGHKTNTLMDFIGEAI